MMPWLCQFSALCLLELVPLSDEHVQMLQLSSIVTLLASSSSVTRAQAVEVMEKSMAESNRDAGEEVQSLTDETEEVHVERGKRGKEGIVGASKWVTWHRVVGCGAQWAVGVVA